MLRAQPEPVKTGPQGRGAHPGPHGELAAGRARELPFQANESSEGEPRGAPFLRQVGLRCRLLLIISYFKSIFLLLNNQCALANLLSLLPLQTRRSWESLASRGSCLRGPWPVGLALRSSLDRAEKLLGSPCFLWGRNSQKLPSWQSLAIPSIFPSTNHLL